MSRSPLAYPLVRSIDGDSGGAADLQTDIMRFMAILSLCLVAIFALVQSIPLAAEIPPPATEPASPPLAMVAEPVAVETPPAVVDEAVDTAETIARPLAAAPLTDEPVVLARPKWVSTFKPREPRAASTSPPTEPAPAKVPEQTAAMTQVSAPVSETIAEPSPARETQGFTLRFESDLALTRLVAAGQVGFYAIDSDRAQRMSVSNSRISFWDASTPNSFHEMEARTVPSAVVKALERTGADSASVDWGVTLPGRLSSQLSTLMQQHSGGALVINADGDLVLETS